MNKGGRPPKPTATLERQGTRRRDRHGESGSEPVAEGKPTPPSWLKGETLQYWNAIVPLLDDMGILGAADSSELAALCQAWCNYRKVQKRFDRNRANIYEVSSATKTFMSLAAGFGLNPVARAKLVTVKKAEPDPLIEILRGNLN